MSLSATQIKQFKAKAQQLKPVVMIGQHGLTENVINEVDGALNAHELLKIKIASEDRVERKAIALRLCDTLGAEFVQSIGRTAVLYRHNPLRKKRPDETL